jgi:O-antigen ligase
MKILLPLFLLYLFLFLLWGLRDLKRFLLFTGVFTIPFAIDYGFVYGVHIGWVSGIFIRLSDISWLLLPLVWLAGGGVRPHLAPRVSIPTVAFILACLFSLANSTAGGFSFYQVVQLSTLFVCYFLIAANTLTGEEDLRLVVRFLMISLLFQSALSIFQHQTAIDLNLRTGQDVSFMTVGEGVVRSFGTIGRPNAFGAYIAPLIIMAQVMIMSGVERGRGLAWLAMVLGVLALIFSFSRGAWISFAVANVFLVLVALKRRLEWVKRLLLAQLVVGAIIFPFSLIILQRIFGYDANAAWSRWPLMVLAWNMIQVHPLLGVGVNTFLNVAPYYITPDIAGAWVGEVHNMYLLVFAEAGVVGLVTFLWMMGAVFSQAVGLSRAEDPFLSALGLGGMGAMVAVATHMFVDMFTGSILLSLFFLLAALFTVGNRLRLASLAERTEEEVVPVGLAAGGLAT